MVEFLLQLGACPNIPYPTKAVMVEEYRDEKTMLSIDLSIRSFELPLGMAAVLNDVRMLSILLDNRADINGRNSLVETAL